MKKQQGLFVPLIIALIAFMSMSITSCLPKATPAPATMWFHLHTNIDTNEVDDTSALYRDANGRRFGLKTAQFLISNVVLRNVNGTTYPIANAYVLKDIDSEQYLVGQVPAGTYNGVSFDVGLDNATNALQPYGFKTIGYVPNTTMWYGNTTQGYMFMKIQGFADTTVAQNGTRANALPFSYEIGAEAGIGVIAMPTRGTGAYSSFPVYPVVAGGVVYVHLICDYGKLLNGIVFKPGATGFIGDTTDTYNINPTLSHAIVNNFNTMFRYEE